MYCLPDIYTDSQSVEYKLSTCFRYGADGEGEGTGDNDADSASGIGAGAQSDAQSAENDTQGGADLGGGAYDIDQAAIDAVNAAIGYDTASDIGSGPDIAGLAAATAALDLGVDRFGNVQDAHFSRAWDNAIAGDWSTALGDIALGVVDRLGGYLGSTIGSRAGAALGSTVAGPIGAVIGALVGMQLGSTLGTAAAHSTHSGATGTAGAIGSTGGESEDAEAIVRAFIEQVGTNGLEETIAEVRQFIENDLKQDPKVYAKKRQYQNIIGSAEIAAYNLLV